MNAAAQIYAQRKGISLYRYLGPEDKLSLSYLKTQPPTFTTQRSKPARMPKPKQQIPELDSPFVPQALKNGTAYPYVYIWENSLRDVILAKYGREKAWWTDSSKVSKEIQDYATRIATAEKKYPWSPDRGDHPVYYVGMVDLFAIIEKNWTTFKDVFKDLEQLRASTKECAPIRNMVAHNVPVSNVDITNMRIKAIYLWRTITKWQLANASSP